MLIPYAKLAIGHRQKSIKNKSSCGQRKVVQYESTKEEDSGPSSLSHYVSSTWPPKWRGQSPLVAAKSQR